MASPSFLFSVQQYMLPGADAFFDEAPSGMAARPDAAGGDGALHHHEFMATLPPAVRAHLQSKVDSAAAPAEAAMHEVSTVLELARHQHSAAADTADVAQLEARQAAERRSTPHGVESDAKSVTCVCVRVKIFHRNQSCVLLFPTHTHTDKS